MASGWFVAGKTLGLALDCDAGTLRVSVDGGAWAVAFQDGCAPGAAVGAALFPVISGKGGARFRANWGWDKERPMRHLPPEGDYRLVEVQQQPIPLPPLPSCFPIAPPSEIAIILQLHLFPLPACSGSVRSACTRAAGVCEQ